MCCSLLTSRVADFLATSSAESRAEQRSGGLAETESTETGNPDIRIPENLPAKGRRAERAEEGKTAGAWNSHIRVPETLKSKEGLRAWRAEREEDAEGRGAENIEKGDSGGDEGTNDPYLGERLTFTGREDTSEGQDGPKKPEVRHVQAVFLTIPPPGTIFSHQGS
ncbi:hypothetical protein NDU88_006273 [Pleurodeles waltl]|uniref:Uncharacterized protein n=1 Tax=Pleurodeles waltl TaxID=8319 RepID=A0AAV7TWM7_PLEWA|nr:hypothetical protein NDU88_006273 [Pleurodeles waltl]